MSTSIEGSTVGRWVRIDRRYNQPYRLTRYASRAIFKWTGLVLEWVLVNSVLAAAHLSLLILASTGVSSGMPSTAHGGTGDRN